MLATAILPVQTQVMIPLKVMIVSQAGRGRTIHLVKFEQILCFLASFGSHCGAIERWFC